MAKTILGQSYLDPTVVTQVVKDAHRFFWASLDAEETETVRNNIFLQAVLYFLWAATDGCLPAWERASKPDNEELSSWSRTRHKEALQFHAGSPTQNTNNAPVESLASGIYQQLTLSIEEQTKFLE